MDRYFELYGGSIYLRRPALVPGGQPSTLAMYDSPAEIALAFTAEGAVVRIGKVPDVQTYAARWNALFDATMGVLTFDAAFDKENLVRELNEALQTAGYIHRLKERLDRGNEASPLTTSANGIQ